ncbi:MAG: TraR/DksA family transcriptional regulator [Kofleriaceae bacterium]|nr:TraR/DksA family transcriptional regulator [Candidatus Methylomirabilis lanthanidiphila]
MDAAIQRHKAGTYGHCAGCGEEIPLPRLQALPFAQRCAPCQEEWEDSRR